MDSNIDSAFSLLAFCVVFLGIRIRSTSPIFAEKRCISFISYIKPQQAFSSMTLPNICFNPRTHTGCDNSYYSQYLGGKSFQSTHPHGVRPLFVAPVCFLIVSIHAPTRGATRIHTDLTMDIKVSIHAPTRGATRTEQIISVQAVVSIHAPTRGATVVVVASHILSSFNPRTHTGCDENFRGTQFIK